MTDWQTDWCYRKKTEILCYRAGDAHASGLGPVESTGRYSVVAGIPVGMTATPYNNQSNLAHFDNVLHLSLYLSTDTKFWSIKGVFSFTSTCQISC